MSFIEATIGNSTAWVNGQVTAHPLMEDRSFYRSMIQDVVNRIDRRLADLGISRSAASKKAGLSVDAIRNLARASQQEGRKGANASTLQKLAPVLKTSIDWLLEGKGDEVVDSLEAGYVQIVGFVGANSEGTVEYATGQAAFDLAPIPPGGTLQARALEVRGISMGDFAPNGALIYFEEQYTTVPRDLLGAYCVVETELGAVLVKRLLRGSEPNLFDLESLTAEPLRDVRLRWAAEVTAVIPPRRARKMIIRAEERIA